MKYSLFLRTVFIELKANKQKQQLNNKNKKENLPQTTQYFALEQKECHEFAYTWHQTSARHVFSSSIPHFKLAKLLFGAIVLVAHPKSSSTSAHSTSLKELF